MRWPFRRPSTEDARIDTRVDAHTEPEPNPETAPEPEPPFDHEDHSTAAWQDLPSMQPSLRAMPTMTDASFSRSLPTRWTTPPALGALGHDVRTDVPGGLVSGVARTVDPRDTRPADLIWRMPDLSGLRTSRTTTSAPRPAPTLPISQPLQPTSTVPAARPTQPIIQSDHAIQMPRPAQPGHLVRTSQLTNDSPSARTTQATHPTHPTHTSRTTRTVQTSVSPSTSTSTASSPPIAGSPDTTQTRQVLHNAASAVEAREPRPVPADVTDGPAANAPVPGVNVEPGTETLDSPPSTPISEPDSLLTPREARPGPPNPFGSAPAAAPLVSRTALPRVFARTKSQPTKPALKRPAPMPEPTLRPSDVAPDETRSQQQIPTGTSLPTRFPLDEPQTSTSPSHEPPSPQLSQTPANEPQPTPIDTPVPIQVPAPGPTPAPAPTPITSRVAPLISAARFTPATAPISVLQAPITPVDQPVHAAESILGADSFVGTLAAAGSGPAPRGMPRAGAGSGTTASVLHTLQSTVQRETQAVVHRPPPPPPPARSQPQPQPQQTQQQQQPPSPAPQIASSTNVAHTLAHTSTHTPAAHDPAALDSLARQLYGRFSRQLAGELLIDRERAQFLTDLM